MTKQEYEAKVLSLKGTHDYNMLCFIRGEYIASLEAEVAQLKKDKLEYSHVTVDNLDWEEICLYMAKLLADEIQIDERIAVALSKVLGSHPTFWINLSNNYLAAKAQEEE